MAKRKYYAVKKGRKKGIYETWEACKEQVDGVSGAIYKSFYTREEAEAFVQGETAGFNKETGDESDAAVAYVDGSYNVKTGEYGCGVVFFYEGMEWRIARKGEDETLAGMRNVAGEILGAQLAMCEAKKRGIKELVIVHDYQGIASWCLGEWKTNKEGTRAYKACYDSVKGDVNIRFKKVKGHSGDRWNDLADELAKSTVFPQ